VTGSTWLQWTSCSCKYFTNVQVSWASKCRGKSVAVMT
jgi:hypothetical protein